jgi:hypothetical protein
MAAARGNDVNRYSRVKQQRLMRRTQVMKAQVYKTQLTGAARKFFRQPTGIPRPIEAKILTEGGRRRKHKRVVGQPNQRQVDRILVPYAGGEAQVSIPFSQQ